MFHYNAVHVFFICQELRYAHEELVKQKTEYKNRVQERESEIERLRNQVGKMFK